MTGQQWDDIGYNFLVGGDGRVYEGRGWDSVGAHTLSWNRRSLGVALIGNFTEAAAPDRQAAAALELIRVGVGLGKLSAGHRLAAACQLRPYQSPGLAQFERVRVWDRWWPWSTADAYCRVGGKSKHKKVALPAGPAGPTGLPAWLSGARLAERLSGAGLPTEPPAAPL
ncbi:hypothetical protein ONE63_008156 [Megalurothrips usitatus]|uniref:Peptidoglycan recognition protein family domain-containing protein n=1 Tax=Megalurothrips usitatus TaxID=439358 RepID=A0AAV7WZL4_9NEOP|nr:hypothetical protein ONE63_011569 [Megalurothrips usitatus]KAJ1526569.1 hypothetical protein ONE63_008156 [Megalurothrips usitatus]